jgi:2,5-furandicarboxylate decarboxylase 1
MSQSAASNVSIVGRPTGSFVDLRSWLDHLAATDRLAVVKSGRNLRFEVAAIAKHFDGEKGTFFPEPGHPVPVVSGLISNRHWMAEALGVPSDQLLSRFQHAVLNPLPCNRVTGGPVQEIVHRTVDLQKLLPLPTHNEHDSGPYITAGLVIARNLKTGNQNVTIHRLQLNGPDKLGVLMLPRHTLSYYRMAADAGESLPVTIVIGVDPVTLLASQAILPLDFDEMTLAGALHGHPLDVTPSVTNDVLIPANAEIAIEGRILVKEREPEGPFGEFPQYYGERSSQHVIAIDAVTHRRDPIFHTILGGGLEHLMLGGIPREATILTHLQRVFTCVKDVHLSPGGVCRYHLYVQIEKRNDGEAKNVILAALGAHYDIKHVVVVDSDVDIHNPQEVEWAIATRFQADRDVVIVSDSQGSRLDPSARDGVGAKAGFDATIPVNSPPMKFKRIKVPGEDAIDFKAVLQSAGTAWR